MPLLHKKNFVKKKTDFNLKPTEKVFFCELTEEVFTDYDEFWERLVLLNALVWTCELTGRPNLTYQEALECENKARKCISNISIALKKPLLFISTYTRRGRMIDANDDIFNYIRDRYFVGEEVEAIVSNHWYDCKVTKVILPTAKEILDYEKSLEDSDDDFDDSNPKLVNGNHKGGGGGGDDDDDIMIIRDDHVKTPVVNNNVNETSSHKDGKDYPPFPSVKYEVVEIEPWDYKEPKHHYVSWDQIRRNKSAFTREKCKMFVKQSMMLSLEGYWKLKDSVINKFKIKQMKYSDIFVGNPPKFKETKLKKLPILAKMNERKKEKKTRKMKGKDVKEKKDDGKKKESEGKKKEEKKKIKIGMSEEEKEAARKFQLALKEKSKEMIRKKLEKLKIERKFKKDLEKEENRLMKLYESEWWQKREDLECEDHKNLPHTLDFTCRIPCDYFGEFLMILDFVNTFADILELGDVYPNGITYDMLEYALVEKEVAGVFNDVVQLLLGAIFSLQEEEDEEIEGDTTMDMASMNLEEHLENKSQIAAVNIANKASTWSQQYQGLSLQKAPLDALTLTEVLRLHILASGATNVANAFWRHMNRGGYKHTDDPGLQFKLDEPEIIKKLSTESLFDMAIEEKIKILNVLVSQILTYASVRDNIEEKLDKLKEISSNYRTYRFAAIRKEKEELTAKKQKLKDIKIKMDKKLLEQQLQPTGESDPSAENKAKVVAGEQLEDEEEKDVEKETRATYKKKEEEERREKDFIEQIESLCNDVKQFQLGQDRAFRRYWVFSRIPGLFIEDRNMDIGTCLDNPTPVHSIIYPKDDKELKEIIKTQAIRNVQIRNKEKENEKNNSDKENDNGETPTKSEVKTPLSEKNLLKAPNNNIVNLNSGGNNSLDLKNKSYSPSNISVDIEEEEIVDLITVPEIPKGLDTVNIEELHSKIFGLCSANALTCPAHTQNHNRPRWSYLSSVEELEQLILNLNVRGIRESELKENLILHRDKIMKSIEKMPSFIFNGSNKDDSPHDLKKALKRNLNFPPGTPIDRILELTLRDMILEIEEKIDNGMLGMLKISERDTWRQAIVDGTSLSFNSPQDLDWGGKKRINQFKSFLAIETTEDDLLDMEEFVSKDGLNQAGVVKELAIAILQVEQALDHKYLKPPLAESDKTSRKLRKVEERLKKKYKKIKKDSEPKVSEANNEDSSEEDEEEESQEIKTIFNVPKNVDNSLRTPLERWEKSLMACTSFSQLFLHLATFDNSVSWARSAVANKRCRVCRKSSDPDNMLLCDKCDGGLHMHCLKPKLKSIPVGDWFCDKCKPKEKSKSPKKQRIMYKEESDEEQMGEEEEEEEEYLEDEDEEEPEIINQEFCSACQMGGEIVLCDTCPRSFHLDCADLRKIPRGNWSCPSCKDRKDRQPSKKKSKSGKSPKSKKPNIYDEIDNALQRVTKTKYNQSNENGIVDSGKRGVKRTIEEVENEELHKDTIENLIHKLMSHTDSPPFRKPIFRNDAPDYYEKIKKPIDLRTIKIRFNKNKYVTDTEFIADVLLIFQNTQQYFDENSIEYKAGLRLSKYFLNKVKESNLHSADLIESRNEKPSKKKRNS